MDFETNGLSKKVNAVQKEISAKKKVCLPNCIICLDWIDMRFEILTHAQVQAKENADELVAEKKELDAQVDANRKKSKEFEQVMRQRASTVGNIVGKGVPVSQTEVSLFDLYIYYYAYAYAICVQDDNATLRTWHPAGPNAEVEKKTDVMPHHEVLLRLDAMDLDRGVCMDNWNTI